MPSPYTTRAVTVCIGPSGSKYTVLQAIVDQYSGLREKLDRDNINAPIVLREVDDDIGHTLIHYLYTGQYETLPQGSDATVATEFRRGVLAYCAAKLCGIEKLEEITKEKIEELSKNLSIFNLQGVAEEVAPKLPRKGDWFSAQMNKWIKAALVQDDGLLSEKGFLDIIGRSAVFDRAVVKSLTEMYDDQKAKNSILSGSKATVEGESVTAPDSVKPNGIITHDLDATVGNEEYSPMPSEEPSESTFEGRHSSIGKGENPSRPDNPTTKPTDSEVEVPKVAKPKKQKRKKGKKSDPSGVRQSLDDEPQNENGD